MPGVTSTCRGRSSFLVAGRKPSGPLTATVRFSRIFGHGQPASAESGSHFAVPVFDQAYGPPGTPRQGFVDAGCGRDGVSKCRVVPVSWPADEVAPSPSTGLGDLLSAAGRWTVRPAASLLAAGATPGTASGSSPPGWAAGNGSSDVVAAPGVI